MQLIAMLRHLPTTDDVSDLYTANSANPPLTDIPAEKLRSLQNEISSFISAFKIESIYLSDNPRGVGSAEALFRNKAPARLHFDARLNNILQPEWAGLTQDAVKPTRLYKIWHTKPISVAFEDGETLSDVGNRIGSFMRSLAGQSSVIISHTTPMQVLACTILNLPIDRIWTFKFDHLSFTVVAQDLLLRLNSDRISDIRLSELRLPPKE